MAKTNRQYNYNKLCRQTKGFQTKPSVNEKKKLSQQRSKCIEKHWKERYTEQDRIKAKFGIFHKKGYVSVELFESKEEAEKRLSEYRCPQYYEVREILGWGLDDE